jgi:feruloyl esterase
LLCHGDETADCLTQPQIEALQKIYSGPKDPITGEQVYPGYEPGTEADPAAWGPWILGPIQPAFANSFFAQAVHEDRQWDWHTADLGRELRLADEKTASILNSWNPDLRSFRAHGGKLIQYHGWGDAAIAPRDSIAYYEKVRAFLALYPDPRSTNGKEIESFYRLFMVPGMQHCFGGEGPTGFGNDEIPRQDSALADADHDVVFALDRWVTQGVAPERLIGTGSVGGTHLARPLCVYPAVAYYKGQGDTNSPENFTCR